MEVQMKAQNEIRRRYLDDATFKNFLILFAIKHDMNEQGLFDAMLLADETRLNNATSTIDED